MGEDMDAAAQRALEGVRILQRRRADRGQPYMGDHVGARQILGCDELDPWAVRGRLRLPDHQRVAILVKGNAPAGFVAVGDAAMLGEFVQRVVDGGGHAAGHGKKFAHRVTS